MDHTAKDDLIRFLLAENAELKSRIAALEVRLAKNSHNSSKPRPRTVCASPHPNPFVRRDSIPRADRRATRALRWNGSPRS
ncbi:DUF6444 domain-containing protein [Acidithiobacillus ferrianus]